MLLVTARLEEGVVAVVMMAMAVMIMVMEAVKVMPAMARTRR